MPCEPVRSNSTRDEDEGNKIMSTPLDARYRNQLDHIKSLFKREVDSLADTYNSLSNETSYKLTDSAHTITDLLNQLRGLQKTATSELKLVDDMLKTNPDSAQLISYRAEIKEQVDNIKKELNRLIKDYFMVMNNINSKLLELNRPSEPAEGIDRAPRAGVIGAASGTPPTITPVASEHPKVKAIKDIASALQNLNARVYQGTVRPADVSHELKALHDRMFLTAAPASVLTKLLDASKELSSEGEKRDPTQLMEELIELESSISAAGHKVGSDAAATLPIPPVASDSTPEPPPSRPATCPQVASNPGTAEGGRPQGGGGNPRLGSGLTAV